MPKAPLKLGKALCENMNIEEYEFKSWDILNENEKSFLLEEDIKLFHSNHIQRISILERKYRDKFAKNALDKLPSFSKSTTAKFSSIETFNLYDVWGDNEETAKVSKWLHNRGIPYSTTVYLLYSNVVVKTDWKTVVKYWDAFAWSVGVHMLALDLSKNWVCEFHHEDTIVFYSH